MEQIHPRVPSNLDALVRALRDADPSVQSAVAAALEHVPADAAVPALTAALRDDHAEVRAQAALVLTTFGAAAASALPELLIARRDPSRDVQAAAARAIDAIEAARANARPASRG